MPIIEVVSEIESSTEVIFDLSRSIDLHKDSQISHDEKVIDGRVTGLIELGETVTWRAKHFGIYQLLTTKIVDFKRPYFFRDIMIDGIFKCFEHDHYFMTEGTKTVMKDVLSYESPLGIMGKFADKLFLKKYIFSLLDERNCVIRKAAESDKWKCYIKSNFNKN